MRNLLLPSIVSALVVLAIACSEPSESKPQASEVATVEPAPPALSPAPAAAASPASAFEAIDRALASGAYDSAAAQLLEMRARGKQFSEQESALYRKALNDAYLQALEAAQKGDPRGKAAIEMIRANSGG